MAMYKHILIPTDGSATADKAVEEGLKLAKWAGAKVTFFTATPPPHLTVGGSVPRGADSPLPQIERRALEQANRMLDQVAERARRAGIEPATSVAVSDTPWKAIIQAAEEGGCDLVCIGSHGRGGVSALLQGSETLALLGHSQIPTLVCR